MNEYLLRQATFDQLTVEELYDILQLRNSVFVVEQKCYYLDLDDRDREHSTKHWWLSRDNQVAAYLRVLVDADDTTHIGRVCTEQTHRGKGLARQLLRQAIDDVTTHSSLPIEIHAQSYLQEWYKSFGFVVTGDEFIEAGVAHVPMRRDSAIDLPSNPTLTQRSTFGLKGAVATD